MGGAVCSWNIEGCGHSSEASRSVKWTAQMTTNVAGQAQESTSHIELSLTEARENPVARLEDVI